jgi:Uncharacterized protein conserved in bacteria
MKYQPYVQLVRYKQWADRGIYEVITENSDRISQEDQAILRRLLDHIHTVDRIFQHHLRGIPHGFMAAQSQMLPELRELDAGSREVDAWYVDYVSSLREHALEEPIDFVFTSGKPARMRRGEIILHVCLHGTYHRGNVGAVLYKHGITPNRDSITDFLEAERL